jgi:hypothetical protein
MKYVLLVGAGFSCNWGDWNATEVNDFLPTEPALRADRHVTQVLTRTAGTGGFEEALAEIEDEYDRSPTSENRAHLVQSAITTMFLTMSIWTSVVLRCKPWATTKRPWSAHKHVTPAIGWFDPCARRSCGRPPPPSSDPAVIGRRDAGASMWVG